MEKKMNAASREESLRIVRARQIVKRMKEIEDALPFVSQERQRARGAKRVSTTRDGTTGFDCSASANRDAVAGDFPLAAQATKKRKKITRCLAFGNVFT